MGVILSNFRRFVKALMNWLKVNIIWILMLFLMFAWGFILGAKVFRRPPMVITGNVVKIDDLKQHLIESKTAVKSVQTTATISQAILDSKVGFVASKRGKYYYPLTCKLADSLSKANLIYFENELEAKNAGYLINTKCQ